MKKFVVFIVSFVLLMNTMSIAAFGAEGEKEPETAAGTDAYAYLIESTYMNRDYEPDELLRIPANSTFTAYIGIDSYSGVSYDGAQYELTVSGSGFTVDGSSANRRGVYREGRSISVPIRISGDAATGMYAVTISVTLNVDGETMVLSQTLNVYVMGAGEVQEPDNSDGSVIFDITSAPNGAVSAGDTFNVGFSAYLSAVYTYAGAAQGVLSVSGTGFSLAGSLAEQNIANGSNTATLLADKSLESGRYQVQLTVTYKVGAESYTASRSLNIDIVNGTEEVDESKDNASFKLTSASFPEAKGRSGLATKLSVSFENTTDFTAENVKITLSSLGDMILNTYTDTVDVGTVEGGHKINATFPIKFPEYPKAQTTLGFTVSYETGAGPQEDTFNVYLQATEKKEEEANPESASLTPKVIISQYAVDVEEVVSGEEFTLTFTLENTSTEKDLRNMTVNVIPKGYTESTTGASSGPVFSFIDGTSSFYTDLLEKSGTLEYSIRLKCSASAGAGSYPIEINFDFEYANAGGYNPGSGEMDINIPVKQPVKFDLLEWTPPTECGLEGTMITFQYFNKSRNPMTNLTISMEGDFDMPPQSVATLNASNADYFAGTITPKAGAKVGDVLTAVLVFTFEDAAGEEQRKEETFEVTVVESTGGDMSMDSMMGGVIEGGDFTIDYVDPSGTDGMQFDENGMPITSDSDDKGGLPLWAKIAIPVGAAAVLIAVVVVVVKKVKKKKEAEDDDDEE